ncbi:MAG: hypothetical protein AB7O24_19275 [Kofleriaceae bacterium]
MSGGTSGGYGDQRQLGIYFSFSSVFSAGFSVFFKNLIPFLVMALVCYAPLLLYALIAPPPSIEGLPIEDAAWATLKTTALVGLGSLICQQLLVSTVTYAAVRELRGQHASFKDSMAMGLSRLLPTIAVSIVAAIGQVLGLLALLIPGLILMCMWYVAVPASVVERPGILGALGRSRELTRGYRWPIFGIIIVVGLISGAANGLLETVFVDTYEVADDLELPTSWRTYMVYEVLSSLVFGALGAAMAAAAYVGLRHSKDGIGADELARVFD